MKTIYIVDDDLLSSQLLYECCIRHHDAVVCINQPADFIDLTVSDDSLIFLDLMMPKIDGIEVIRIVAQRQCKARFVLMSGSDPAVIQSAQMLAVEQGVNILTAIPKPFNIAEISKIVKQFQLSECDQFRGASDSFSAEEKHLNITKEVLVDALERKQLVMHYQPQLMIGSDQLYGVEALVRWVHPEKGIIYPNDFVPKAEAFGLMSLLTDEILRLVGQQICCWKREGLTIRVSINIPAGLVADLTFPESVSRLLSEYDVDERMITFELTETQLLSNQVYSLDILTRFRLKGVHLSIDDFGTGFSTLSQLYRLPFNELKIDLSFVSRMDNDSDCYAIVENCIHLGHQMNMQVVAEGVENKRVLTLLEQLGCDVAQGYYLSRPLPGNELSAWHGCYLSTS